MCSARTPQLPLWIDHASVPYWVALPSRHVQSKPSALVDGVTARATAVANANSSKNMFVRCIAVMFGDGRRIARSVGEQRKRLSGGCRLTCSVGNYQTGGRYSPHNVIICFSNPRRVIRGQKRALAHCCAQSERRSSHAECAIFTRFVCRQRARWSSLRANRKLFMPHSLNGHRDRQVSIVTCEGNFQLNKWELHSI